ncbi:unnamed protein product [Discula destructiva]
MRRLARPTGLYQGYPHQQQHQQQSYHTRGERQSLSKYPAGTILHQGHAPRKANFPIFELSDLVLDLDAEDSPHVRSYNEEKDGPLQDSKWGYDPAIADLKSEAASIKRSMSTDFRHSQASTRHPFHGRRLADTDIMAAALLVGSAPPDDPRLCQLKAETLHDGIPSFARSHPGKIIPFMLHRQQLTRDAFRNPSRSTGVGDAERAFRDAIDGCKHLTRLKKLCSRIDRPESGVEVSAGSIDHIHRRLLEFLRAGGEEATPEDVLKFVNNVTIKRLASNKDLNRSMTLFGLQLANRLDLLPCILQYLEICLSLGFITSRAEGLDLTRSQTAATILAALQRGNGTARGTRQQIFTSLTGQGGNGLASQACLFGLATTPRPRTPELNHLYIALLGETGASHLLRHYWRQLAQQRGALQDRQAEAEEVFMKAFLRCGQILVNVESSETNLDLTAGTGGIEQDAARDWRNVNLVDAFHAKQGSEIPRPVFGTSDKAISALQMMGPFGEQVDMTMVLDVARGLQSRGSASEEVSETFGGDEASESSASEAGTRSGDGLHGKVS